MYDSPIKGAHQGADAPLSKGCFTLLDLDDAATGTGQPFTRSGTWWCTCPLPACQHRSGRVFPWPTCARMPRWRACATWRIPWWKWCMWPPSRSQQWVPGPAPPPPPLPLTWLTWLTSRWGFQAWSCPCSPRVPGSSWGRLAEMLRLLFSPVH